MSLEHRNHIFICHLRANPLFFTPDTTAVRPVIRVGARFKERFPFLRTAGFQWFKIVLHVQQTAAILAAVDHIKN